MFDGGPAGPSGSHQIAEEKQGTQHGATLAERVFVTSVLPGVIAPFLSTADLVSLCSCCRLLQHQEQPGGSLHASIEKSLKPLVSNLDTFLHEAFDPHNTSRGGPQCCGCASAHQGRLVGIWLIAFLLLPLLLL